MNKRTYNMKKTVKSPWFLPFEIINANLKCVHFSTLISLLKSLVLVRLHNFATDLAQNYLRSGELRVLNYCVKHRN